VGAGEEGQEAAHGARGRLGGGLELPGGDAGAGGQAAREARRHPAPTCSEAGAAVGIWEARMSLSSSLASSPLKLATCSSKTQGRRKAAVGVARDTVLPLTQLRRRKQASRVCASGCDSARAVGPKRPVPGPSAASGGCLAAIPPRLRARYAQPGGAPSCCEGEPEARRAGERGWTC
jgi:hypothetical protein